MEKQYGDTVDCSGINVIQTYDNGFLITASKNPVSQYEDDLFIIRTNQIGDTLWTKTMPLESGIIAKGIQTFDSGYVFTGKTDIYLFLLKIGIKQILGLVQETNLFLLLVLMCQSLFIDVFLNRTSVSVSTLLL